MNFKEYILENKKDEFIGSIQNKFYKINMNSWTPHTLTVRIGDYICQLTIKFNIIFKIKDAKILYYDYVNLDRSRKDWINNIDELFKVIDIIDLEPRETRFYDITKNDKSGSMKKIKDKTEEDRVQNFAIGEVIENLLNSFEILSKNVSEGKFKDLSFDPLASYHSTLIHTILPRIQTFLEEEADKILSK
jgi:hypothetical protein